MKNGNNLNAASVLLSELCLGCKNSKKMKTANLSEKNRNAVFFH